MGVRGWRIISRLLIVSRGERGAGFLKGEGRRKGVGEKCQSVRGFSRWGAKEGWEWGICMRMFFGDNQLIIIFYRRKFLGMFFLDRILCF